MGARDSLTLTEADMALADEMAACFADPLRFVIFSFPWGEGDLAEYDGPDDWQRDTLRDIGAGVLSITQAMRKAEEYEAVRVATASGHGIGKSALVAWIILWAMSTRPHLAGVVTANTGTQLDTKTWRELSVWHKRCITGHWFKWTATKFAHMLHPETWFVAAIPWSENRSEAFAGLHADYVLLIFDEASAIADKIWEVAEGAQTSGEVIWAVFGNPTRNTGRFRECFGRFRNRWKTRQIDSRKCRMANKTQAAQWVADYGEDSDFVRIRVRGEFPRAGSNQFIASDVVEEAQKRRAEIDPGAPLIMGVDVARFGDDKSIIRFRRGRDARSIPAQKYRGVDTMTLSSYIVEAIAEHNPVVCFIDGNGVGGGVVDRVISLLGKRPNCTIIEVQAGGKANASKDYFNKRAECWGLMRKWLEVGAIDEDTELRDDLIGPEYGFDSDNRIQLEKKDDMKKRGLASPDDGDTLSLTFAQPVGRRDIDAKRNKDKPREMFAHSSAEGSWMN
jgi:hypothetical protein